MQKSIASKDTAVFNTGFQILRTECRNCHKKEDVPFIQSEIPQVRLSPIKFQKKASDMMLGKKMLLTDDSKTTILIRLLVGVVFLSEGIQKFLFPDELGAGRFEKIGLPAPEFLGSFVGTFEIACGALVLLGLFTRFASIPLIIIMLVAISTTKAEILAEKGFWDMMHGSRTDWSMLLGSIFLLIKGGDYWSSDNKLTRGK